ncbi:hypothetical protein HDV03_004012 [Kappamyces sp. JEL0829]|nr:hypothetical protein HDV03_004012 [Kappamyces sp. JEL0829]
MSLPIELYGAISEYLNAREYFRLRRSCRRILKLLSARPLLRLADYVKVTEYLARHGSTRFLSRCDFHLKPQCCTLEAFQYLAASHRRWPELSAQAMNFLKNIPDMDIHSYSSALIRSVTEWGNIPALKAILARPDLDPNLQDGVLLSIACWTGNESVLQLLLFDRRLNPGADDNVALELMASRGLLHSVERLLQDPRVDPRRGRILQQAAFCGRFQVVELLLRDPRMTPSVQDDFCIKNAAAQGHVKTVQVLLQDPRTNPRAQDYWALKMALEHRQFAILELLLADSRVDPDDPSVKLVMAAYGKEQQPSAHKLRWRSSAVAVMLVVMGMIFSRYRNQLIWGIHF